MTLEIEQLPSIQSSAAQNTPDSINAEIERQIEANVNFFKRQDKQTIQNRIAQLEQEWDIERVLKVNLTSVTIASSLLGIAVSKKWLFVSGAASLFMLQHAVQGRCLPLPLVRALGVRTINEINLEKQALHNLLDEKRENN